MDDHGDGVKCGQVQDLSQCECDEMCKEQDYVRTLSGTVCDVHVVKRHAIVDVQCHAVVNVVIGVRMLCFRSHLLLYTLSS